MDQNTTPVAESADTPVTTSVYYRLLVQHGDAKLFRTSRMTAAQAVVAFDAIKQVNLWDPGANEGDEPIVKPITVSILRVTRSEQGKSGVIIGSGDLKADFALV